MKGDFGFDAALYHSVTDPNFSGKGGCRLKTDTDAKCDRSLKGRKGLTLALILHFITQ